MQDQRFEAYKFSYYHLKNHLQGAFGKIKSWAGGNDIEVQGAAGKKIVDLVLIENEVVEENRSTGKKGVVFKIDILKAYVCVEWSFLDLLWIGRDLGQDGGSGFLVLVIGIIFGVDQWEAAR